MNLPESINEYIKGFSGLVEIDQEIKEYQDSIIDGLKKLSKGKRIKVYRTIDFIPQGEDIFYENYLFSFSTSKKFCIALAKERAEDRDEHWGFSVVEVEAYPEDIYFHHKLNHPIGKMHKNEKEVLVNATGYEYDIVFEIEPDDEEGNVIDSFDHLQSTTDDDSQCSLVHNNVE
jgi:hypothetical protein